MLKPPLWQQAAQEVGGTSSVALLFVALSLGTGGISRWPAQRKSREKQHKTLASTPIPTIAEANFQLLQLASPLPDWWWQCLRLGSQGSYKCLERDEDEPHNVQYTVNILYTTVHYYTL